ncbi:MAG: response regulator [Vicinamibacterales bacterium]
MPAATSTVLLLEDDSRDARLIASHLNLEGSAYQVVHVDCEDHYRAAIARGGFDVILADHSLPGFTGVAALAIARQACPDVPFICVSGTLGEEPAIEALKGGATDYVLKHSLSRLVPSVQRALQASTERAKRRKAESEVTALEAQLRHSQKLEAVGLLAGGIAHDFNNLLTVINGYCERLLGTVGDDDAARADLDLIHQAGQRAAGLTRQLLAFSRRQVLAPKAINLNTIVSDIERILKRVLGERIAVASALDPALGLALADPGQMEQVLINLAINARDAMPDGGTVTIETANFDAGRGAAPSPLGPAPYVMLTVRDTGHGMDEETTARIFEPFFTTKPAGKGTGLGLSTVYGIVAQSGGHVDVDSSPGRGTTMRVFLPRVADELEVRPPEEALALAGRGHETLLLVEDEDFVRELLSEFLRSSGYTVIEARSAEEALALFKHDGAMAIDLLVTDMVLSGINGARLAERLKAMIPGLVTLYVSGYPGDEMFADGVFDPGPAFLAKPFTRHALIHKVKEILGARPPLHATVAVAEPNNGIRRLITQMLTRAGYGVVDRIEAMRAGATPVDVALVDVASPDPARWTIVRELRQRHPGASIVLMAGSFGDVLIGEAAAAGVEITLQKPLHEAAVLDAVRRALRQRPAGVAAQGFAGSADSH